MNISEIKFPWEYTDEELSTIPDVIGPHGRCVGYRQEAYHDVYVYDDGYEEWVYICY